MTTLVTGAAGFLGGRLLAQLEALGEPVRGFDIVAPERAPSGGGFVIGSILEPEDIQAAMEGVTHVIHAAAIAALWSPGRFDYDRVNVIGTARVLAAARRAGAGTVVVSSYTTLISAAHQPAAALDESVEIAPNRLLGPYPRSKRQAELVAIAAANAGQRVVIVQPTAPLGAGDVNLTPPTEMIRDLAAGKLPALVSCTLNLVDVGAVVDAILAARRQGQSGARYLLAGHDIAMADLAARIAAFTGVPAPRLTVPIAVAIAAARAEAMWSRLTGHRPQAPLTGVRLAARTCQFDASRAREDLGFAPRPLDISLSDSLAWLEAEGYLHDASYPRG